MKFVTSPLYEVDIGDHPFRMNKFRMIKEAILREGIAKPSDFFDVGSYRIETRRPVYDAIVREEQPDAVIGDVFSLDLSLPLRLARENAIPCDRFFLRVRDYTPVWSRQYLVKEIKGGRAITRLDEITE